MYSQYLGKDKVVSFAQPIAEDVEVHTLADHEGQDNKCTTLIRMLKNNKLDPIAYSLHEGILYR